MPPDEHDQPPDWTMKNFQQDQMSFLNTSVAIFSRSQDFSIQAFQHCECLSGQNNKTQHFVWYILPVLEPWYLHQFRTNYLGIFNRIFLKYHNYSIEGSPIIQILTLTLTNFPLNTLQRLFVLLQIKAVASITFPPSLNIKIAVRRESNTNSLPAVLVLFETTELQLQRHQNWATVAQ